MQSCPAVPSVSPVPWIWHSKPSAASLQDPVSSQQKVSSHCWISILLCKGQSLETDRRDMKGPEKTQPLFPGLHPFVAHRGFSQLLSSSGKGQGGSDCSCSHWWPFHSEGSEERSPKTPRGKFPASSKPIFKTQALPGSIYLTLQSRPQNCKQVSVWENTLAHIFPLLLQPPFFSLAFYPPALFWLWTAWSSAGNSSTVFWTLTSFVTVGVIPHTLMCIACSKLTTRWGHWLWPVASPSLCFTYAHSSTELEHHLPNPP